jgi:hypothetical protein
VDDVIMMGSTQRESFCEPAAQRQGQELTARRGSEQEALGGKPSDWPRTPRRKTRLCYMRHTPQGQGPSHLGDAMPRCGNAHEMSLLRPNYASNGSLAQHMPESRYSNQTRMKRHRARNF